MFKLSPACRFLTPFRIATQLPLDPETMPHSLSRYGYPWNLLFLKSLRLWKRCGGGGRTGGFTSHTSRVQSETFDPFSIVLSSSTVCHHVCPDEVQVLPAAGNSFVHSAEGPGPCRKGGAYCWLGMMSELTLSSLHGSKKINMVRSGSTGEGVASSLDTPQVCQRKEQGEPLGEQFLTENPLQSLQGQPASCPVFQLARPGHHCVLVFRIMKQSRGAA